MKNKALIFRVLTVALGLMGIAMLVSGLVLRHLDEANKTVPQQAEMPEAYIEEFFSGEDNTPRIEDYIEPAANTTGA